MNIRIQFCIVIIATFAGCQLPPPPGTIAASPKPFAGLKAIIEKEGPIRMLLVHGMSDHDPGWATTYLGPYAQHLGANLEQADLHHLTPEEFSHNAFLKSHKNLNDTYSSTLTRYKITRDGKTIIVAYELTWSQLTRPFKKARFVSDISPDRLALNQVGKEFVNGVLSDVVLYLAGYDDHVLEDSVCAAVEIFDKQQLGDDGIAKNGPIVMVSESQGSIMLFDALLGEAPYNKGTHVRTVAEKYRHGDLFQRTKMFIMNANQLRLLDAWPNVSYGDEEEGANLTSTGGAPNQSKSVLKRLGDLRRGGTEFHANESMEPMDLLVLTDANDLLSYTIKEGDVPQEIRVINLEPVNAKRTHIPFKDSKWDFENPATAHTGYKDNPAVAAIIVNGSP